MTSPFLTCACVVRALRIYTFSKLKNKQGSGFRAIRSGLLFCVICTDATNVGREVSVPAQVRESPLCPHWRSACCSDSCVSCVNRCAWLAAWCSAWCVQQSRSCPSRIGEAAGHGWRRWFAEARITCAQPLPRRVDTGLQAALRVRKKGTENHACLLVFGTVRASI